MIMVLDVGNSNTKCGLFEGDRLLHSWRMATSVERSSDELGVTLTSFFNFVRENPSDVDGIMISSVVPSINYTIEHMCRVFFKRKPLFVGPGIKTGINILYDNPRELGSDRIVNAVAAYEKYGGPCITVDFGTATSFGAISAGGDFLGGVICPGVKTASEALTVNTAKLPRVELYKPKNIINRNTVGCMQAGIMYGYVGQVDYILRKMKAEMKGDVKVIATGGLSSEIAEETATIDVIDSLLTLEGLRIIYEKNKEVTR